MSFVLGETMHHMQIEIVVADTYILLELSNENGFK